MEDLKGVMCESMLRGRSPSKRVMYITVVASIYRFESQNIEMGISNGSKRVLGNGIISNIHYYAF